MNQKWRALSEHYFGFWILVNVQTHQRQKLRHIYANFIAKTIGFFSFGKEGCLSFCSTGWTTPLESFEALWKNTKKQTKTWKTSTAKATSIKTCNKMLSNVASLFPSPLWSKTLKTASLKRGHFFPHLWTDHYVNIRHHSDEAILYDTVFSISDHSALQGVSIKLDNGWSKKS